MVKKVKYNGAIYNFPDDASEDEIYSFIDEVDGATLPASGASAPPVTKPASGMNEVGRQLLRTGRNVAGGVVSPLDFPVMAVQGVADLIHQGARGVANLAGADLLPSTTSANKVFPLPSQAVTDLIDNATGGLTAPRNTTEKVVDFTSQLATGVGVAAKATGAAGKALELIGAKSPTGLPAQKKPVDIKKAASNISLNKSIWDKGEKEVIRSLKKSGMSDDRIIDFLELTAKGETNLSLAEMTQNKALMNIQRNIMQSPGRGQDLLFKKYMERAEKIYPGDFNKFLDDFSKTKSLQLSGENAIDVAKNLYQGAVAARKEAASGIYEQASKQVLDTSKFAPLIKDPIIDRAVQKVSSDPFYNGILQEKGYAADSVGFWDLVKRTIDDDIEKFKGSAFMPADKTRMAAAEAAKNRLVKTIDQQVGIYSKARQTFSDMSKPINELDKTLISTIANLGKDEVAKSRYSKEIATKVFSDSPERIIAAKQHFVKNGAKQQWNDLLASQINGLWESSGGDFAKFTNKIDGNEKVFKKLIAGMDSDQKVVFRHLMRNFELAKSIGRGYGSDTATNSFINAMRRNESGADLIKGVAETGVINTARKFVVNNTIDKLMESKNFSVAQILSGETSAQLASKLKKLKAGSAESQQVFSKHLAGLAARNTAPASVSGQFERK